MLTQQHKNWRRIGSSDAPVIMGVSPWLTPFKLWENKLFDKEQEETFAMKRGTEMESLARECFEEMMDVEVFPSKIDHMKINFMTASLDGIDLDRKVAVEIKCPNKETHEIAKQGKIPDYYFPQVQHQLEVTGLKQMYYFSFDGKEGAIVEVKKDEDYIENMISFEKKFWDCLLNFVPPELCDRDVISLDHDQEWKLISEKWKQIESSLKSLEKEEEELRKHLIKIAKDRSVKGNGVQLTRYFVSGNIDYSKIEVLKGMDLNSYRKSGSFRWRCSV